MGCDETAGAAPQNDDSARLRRDETFHRLDFGKSLGGSRRRFVHLLDRVRKTRLVELVLRKNHLAVGSHEDAPQHPAVGVGTKQGVVFVVRDHRKRELVLLPPRPACLLRLEGTHVDHLEILRRKALIHPSNGKSLLPATQSHGFPEDDE